MIQVRSCSTASTLAVSASGSRRPWPRTLRPQPGSPRPLRWRARERKVVLGAAPAEVFRVCQQCPGDYESEQGAWLGGLAVAVGDGPRARELFERSLTIGEELAGGEPENTGYRRDVSVSLEWLGDLAVAGGDKRRAVTSLESAVDTRRQLHDKESDRLDLAEELGVSLQHLAAVAEPAVVNALRAEANAVLGPFNTKGFLTPKGQSTLARADQQS